MVTSLSTIYTIT